AVALPTALLVACGGDSSSPAGGAGQDTATSLMYSFPLDQQQEVPTPTPVVLRFSESIEGDGAENQVALRLNGEEAVPTEARYADDGRSLILTPNEQLQYHADYVVDFADDFPAQVRDFTFSTKAAEEGVKSLVVSDDTLELARLLPSDGE